VISPDHLFLFPGIVLFGLSLVMLGLQAMLPQGVPIGSIAWTPQFAPQILGSVGIQVIWFAIIADVYHANTGIFGTARPGTRLVRAFERSFSLERMLLISLVLLGIGVALEVLLGLQQFDLIQQHAALASAGAFSVIVGLQSFFSSFITYLLSSEQTRPGVRASTAVARSAVRRAELPVPDTSASPAPNTA
jgi:hypothetical protein